MAKHIHDWYILPAIFSPRISKLWSAGHIQPPACYVHKVFLEYSPTLLLLYYLWQAVAALLLQFQNWVAASRLRAHKAKNFYVLTLYRQNLPITDLVYWLTSCFSLEMSLLSFFFLYSYGSLTRPNIFTSYLNYFGCLVVNFLKSFLLLSFILFIIYTITW